MFHYSFNYSIILECRWAEQDPIELLQSVKSCLDECAKKAYISGIQRDDLAGKYISQ